MFILLSLIGYISGYRLDGLSAAKANTFVPKDSVLLDVVDYSWGAVYIFNSPEKPVSAISMKTLGLLWTSKTSVYHYHRDDPIKTIGGVSLGNQREKATVISILVNDPEISYLEVGPEGKRIKKEASIEDLMTFSWEETFQLDRLYPQAFNKNGELLYEYRYPTTNYIKQEDLKWYSTNVSTQQKLKT